MMVLKNAVGGESWLCSNAFYYGVIVKLVAAAGGTTMAMLEAGAGSRPTFIGKPVYSSIVPSEAVFLGIAVPPFPNARGPLFDFVTPGRKFPALKQKRG
ncbi:MAG: hypothetical protein QF435_15260 [Arenicellales bacterium]|jgi:hypothetical protein|nr:hypothetical protein [Arenicellales bacterium]